MQIKRNDFTRPSRRDLFRASASAAAGLMLKPVARSSQDQSLRRSGKPTASLQPAAPEWTKDLIIYEIATKGFTSPKGPETGSFESLKAKLPYLEELGITGIWLTGYALCDSRHFYDIWTQYAVIEPDKLDPSLGTGEEFRSLIEEAHRTFMGRRVPARAVGSMEQCWIGSN
jgi:1,4-alpha-glucan branching enzyme